MTPTYVLDDLEEIVAPAAGDEQPELASVIVPAAVIVPSRAASVIVPSHAASVIVPSHAASVIVPA
jgi:hypothetical protein